MALEVLGLKADLHPTVSLWRGSTRVIERSNKRESERQKARGGKGRKEGGGKRNECPLNLGTSGNVIPISIEEPL